MTTTNIALPQRYNSPTSNPEFSYNPFRRLSSAIIDDVLIGTTFSVILYYFARPFWDYTQNIDIDSQQFFIRFGISVIIGAALSSIYTVYMINRYGQTLGQKMNYLKLTMNDGSKPSPLNIVYRFFIYNLVITSIISLFTVFIREDKKSVTDIACGNKFVAVESKKPFALISAIASTALLIISTLLSFTILK